MREVLGTSSAEIHHKDSAQVQSVHAQVNEERGGVHSHAYYTSTVHPKVFPSMSHVDEPVTEEDKKTMSELPYASIVANVSDSVLHWPVYLSACKTPPALRP